MTDGFVEAMVGSAARAAMSRQYREGMQDGVETTLLLLLGRDAHGGAPCPYELPTALREWAQGALARVQADKAHAGRPVDLVAAHAATATTGPAVFYGPQEIRDHFEGNVDSTSLWVRGATDDELLDVGGDAICDDRVWRAFHDSLVLAIQARVD